MRPPGATIKSRDPEEKKNVMYRRWQPPTRKNYSGEGEKGPDESIERRSGRANYEKRVRKKDGR